MSNVYEVTVRFVGEDTVLVRADSEQEAIDNVEMCLNELPDSDVEIILRKDYFDIVKADVIKCEEHWVNDDEEVDFSEIG